MYKWHEIQKFFITSVIGPNSVPFNGSKSFNLSSKGVIIALSWTKRNVYPTSEGLEWIVRNSCHFVTEIEHAIETENIFDLFLLQIDEAMNAM